jgi:AcrR family transcriptional regulator
MQGSIRPLKRNEEQKLANRQSILTAGMLTFKEKGYSDTSVEDVIVRAEVSRATFYKHFSNKLSLAEALVDEVVSLQDHAYDELALTGHPSQSDIISWLRAIAEIFKENKLLMIVLAELLGAEPSLREAARLANMKRIRKLGKSFSTFRDTADAGADDAVARDRAMLMVTEIDLILFRLTVGEWAIDMDVAIHFLAEQVRHFVAGSPPEALAKPPSLLRHRAAGE